MSFQNISSPEKVKFKDEVESISAEVNRYKAEGIKIFIALGHSGFETDKKIAKEVPDIDLVIGGHTNTFLFTGKYCKSLWPIYIQNICE